MKGAELLEDRIAAAHLDRRRTRELQRQQRIFNTKVRTIGIDKEALEYQVQERRNKEESDANETREYADALIRSDRTACVLEKRQKRDERLQAEAIVQFHQQFQQPSSRREFDLNDPELLKKQDGVRMLPGLVGEDTSSVERTRRQREQMRDWTLQQQQELEQTKELQKLEDLHHEQSRVDLDNRALGLQKMEEEYRRATNITIKDFNQALAAEARERRERERQQEEEINQLDILKHLQGELLSENAPGSVRAPGMPRPRRDCYKGLTPAQLRDYTVSQQQQAEETRRARMEEQREELQQERLSMASARTALLQERQQARTRKELRRTVDQTNKRLAEAQRARKKKETNVPHESYFSQFNTCSR